MFGWSSCARIWRSCAEAAQDVVRIEAAPDEFDRDFFPVIIVDTRREIDGA